MSYSTFHVARIPNAVFHDREPAPPNFQHGKTLYTVPGYLSKGAGVLVVVTTYVLIVGPSYRGLDFEQREVIRENLRIRLEKAGVRFVEYCWVWDEQDRCLLLVGTYENLDEATLWMEALRSMGFELCTRTHLPGEDTEGSQAPRIQG